VEYRRRHPGPGCRSLVLVKSSLTHGPEMTGAPPTFRNDRSGRTARTPQSSLRPWARSGYKAHRARLSFRIRLPSRPNYSSASLSSTPREGRETFVTATMIVGRYSIIRLSGGAGALLHSFRRCVTTRGAQTPVAPLSIPRRSSRLVPVPPSTVACLCQWSTRPVTHLTVFASV
jgi:hypothetical protein